MNELAISSYGLTAPPEEFWIRNSGDELFTNMNLTKVLRTSTIVIGYGWIGFSLYNLTWYKGGWNIQQALEYAPSFLPFFIIGLCLLVLTQIKLKRIFSDLALSIYILTILYLLPVTIIAFLIPKIRLIAAFYTIVVLLPFSYLFTWRNRGMTKPLES